MEDIKYLSTTKLSQKLAIPTKQLFGRLQELGYIDRKDEVWVLNQSGLDAGGQYKVSEKLGKYIVWPESFQLEKATLQAC